MSRPVYFLPVPSETAPETGPPETGPPETGRMENALAAHRRAAGWTQQALADAAGVSRQTLIAVEAGRSVPSVALALRLAQALACPVEALFALTSGPETVDAVLGPPAGPGRAAAPGTRVVLGRVGGGLVAHPLGPQDPAAPRISADGLLGAPRGPGLVAVELLRPRPAVEANLLLAGCAPALGLLAARLESLPGAGGGRVHWLDAGSEAALTHLLAGRVHAAGLHLVDPASGEYNLPELRCRLHGGAWDVHTVTRWEVGLLSAPGNPRGLRSVADLPAARGGVVAREPGSGAHRLMQTLLSAAGVPAQAVRFEAVPTLGHHAAARRVAEGRADACLAPRCYADAFGLDFVPVGEERFDLVVDAALAGDPRWTRLLETLGSRAFRREVGSLAGHDPSSAATHLARLEVA